MTDQPYVFDKEHHIHTLAGRPLHGVTSVLGVIAKPALIQWAADQAVNYIEDNFPTAEEIINGTKTFAPIFAEARLAHRKKKEKAGDWGTRIHEIIEQHVKYGPIDLLSFPVTEADKLHVYRKFTDWVADNNVKFLMSEKNVWSESLWIGGICDFVAEINGKKYIGDFKTSSGIWNEAFFQIAAYDLCLQEMGEYTEEEIAGYIVVNLRKDGGFQTKITTDKLSNQVAFKSALSLYKVIKSL